MKIVLFLLLALSTHLAGHAQTQRSAKIYIFNAAGIGHSLELKTANMTNPITIKGRHWAIIQLSGGDSLGIMVGKQPYFIHFAKGRNYYFVAYADYTAATEVTEKTEQEFFMSVQFNTDNKPEEYTLEK